MLRGAAAFDEDSLTFDLRAPPKPEIARGRYHLISKTRPQAHEENGDGVNQFLYRLSHPLGQHVLDAACALPPPALAQMGPGGPPPAAAAAPAWSSARRIISSSKAENAAVSRIAAGMLQARAERSIALAP